MSGVAFDNGIYHKQELSVVATGYISGLEFTRSHSFFYACLDVTKVTFDTHVTTEVGITSHSRK